MSLLIKRRHHFIHHISYLQYQRGYIHSIDSYCIRVKENMAIFLQGALNYDQEVEISGSWKFLSDKISKLKFSYKRKSSLVPSDLCNEIRAVQRSYKSGYVAKRGRKPSIPKHDNATSSVHESNDNDQQYSSFTEAINLPSVNDNIVGFYEGSFETSPSKGLKSYDEIFFIADIKETSEIHEILSNNPFRELSKNASKEVLKAINIHVGDTNHTSPTTTTTTTTVENTTTTTIESITLPGKHYIGYGRNDFGIFSLHLLYIEDTGAIFAEKIYVHTKTGTVKKIKTEKEGIHEGNNSNNNSGGTGTTTKSSSSSSSSSLVEETPGSIILEVKRRRTESLRLKALSSSSEYISPDKSESITATESVVTTTGKKHHMSEKTKRDIHIANIKYDHSTGIHVDDYEEVDDNDDDVSYVEGYYDEGTCEIYEGSMLHKLKHGMGISLRPDGTLYEGSWVHGKEQGEGKLMNGLDREVIYEGSFMDGVFSGYGTYHFPNKDLYKGEWREGQRHGRGEYIFRNGCKYTGDWRDNKRHGKGIFTWPDGSTYEGDWEQDMRHGRGILTIKNTCKYDGNWVHNNPEGKGLFVYEDGQEYQGSFKQGVREGRGSITFPEGAIYEGRFRDDKLDGMGTIKIHEVITGFDEDELLIPIHIQSDIRRIHYKAGFGDDSHH